MKNSNQLLFPVVLIIAGALILYFFVRPTYAAVKQYKAERTDYNTTLADANKLQSKLHTLEGKMQSFTPTQLYRLNRLIPYHFNNVLFLLMLNNIASKHDMVLEGISFTGDLDVPGQDGNSKDVKNGVHMATVHFNVSGNYETLVSFLKDLEKSLRIIDIQSVQFHAVDPARNVEPGYSITVQTYWLAKQ